MKSKKRFVLSPSYCMYNGAAIIEQKRNKIHFGLVRPEDTELRMSLFQAFATFLINEEIAAVPVLTFSLLTQKQLLSYVLGLCDNSPEEFQELEFSRLLKVFA